MQIQVQHVLWDKRVLGQRGDKQFIHQRATLHANRRLGGGGGMGGDNHPHWWPSLRQRDTWTVVQTAGSPAFRMLTLQIWRACQTCSHSFSIQQAVFLTPSNHAHSRGENLRQRSAVAIQAVQPDQHLSQRKPMREGIPGDRLQSAFQFAAIVSISYTSIRANPLMCERL